MVTGEQNDREREDKTRGLMALGERLTGLELEKLGYLPHPGASGEEPEGQPVSADERAESLRNAKLLAGCLWEASVVLIDQLFEDLDTVKELDPVTPSGIATTSVLSGLPRRFAAGYTPGFVRRFLVVAADTASLLVRGWEYPSCVAQELAVRCLLDQVEVIEHLFDLKLADGWRSILEEQLLEDADSEMLYRRDLDGFEDDIELAEDLGLAPMGFAEWFEPFNNESKVPPYAR